MAIFHLHVRGIAPSRASSAVKSSAYISGSRLLDERTGEVAEYARAERVAGAGLLLPDAAPDWDRQRLWNEAMAVAVGSELAARSYEAALPRELGREQQRALVLEFCESFRAGGRAVDWAIHDSDDGNPHVHVLVSAHELGQDGFVPSSAKPKKSGKVYLCRGTDGSDIMVPAADWKAAKAAGIEKVFNFKDGTRRTLSEAAAVGLTRDDRKSKTPVAVTVTPDGARAFDAEKAALVAERKRWADLVNAALERSGSDERVDHRSLADQGVNRLPTVHEGPVVRKIEHDALLRAALAGVEYEPVTDARRRNLDVARRNGVIADLARRLAEVIDAIKRRVGWWHHRPDRAEPARRRYIAAHRARAMRTAARVHAEQERVERAAMALDELLSRSFSTEDFPGPACWGAQSMLVSGDGVRLMDRSDAGEILKGVDLKAFESVAKSRGFEYRHTEILPSDFTTDQLEFLADKRPDLFDAAAAIEYPEVLEAIDRIDAAAYSPDPMSYVEPEPTRRSGRGFDR